MYSKVMNISCMSSRMCISLCMQDSIAHSILIEAGLTLQLSGCFKLINYYFVYHTPLTFICMYHVYSFHHTLRPATADCDCCGHHNYSGCLSLPQEKKNP